MTAHRERRWLLLSTTGDHTWLGRASDPSEDEIQAAEQAIQRAGVGGYLAVSEGDYWGAGEMAVLRVRDLAGVEEGGFQAAVEAFFRKRDRAKNGEG